MAGKRDADREKPVLGNRRKPGVLPDLDWLRKRRDVAPVIDRGRPAKNPLLHLLRSSEPEQSSELLDDGSENKPEGAG